jgi:hypothetical protein
VRSAKPVIIWDEDVTFWVKLRFFNGWLLLALIAAICSLIASVRSITVFKVGLS